MTVIELNEILASKTRLDKKHSRIVTRTYVHYTQKYYSSQFKNSHVLGDVMLRVAQVATKELPVQLASSDCDLEKPTYVCTM